MKFPKSSNFADFTLHELAVHIIRDRFSGSLEIDYPDNILRIFQFDKGNLCAASSNAVDEQLDNIIRADREPQLSKEQKAYLQERLDTGTKYGKALVETALMSAAELLTYNSKQASAIFAGALRGKPLKYRTERGNANQYRPLPIDPYTIIRKSLLHDVDAGLVRDMLGDEDTSYMKSDSISGGSKALQEDEEIRAILSHLDGRRSIREIAARIGLNPDRTSRMLLMLKMMDWIEPAVGGENEYIEERYLESPDRLVGATSTGETTGQDYVEDNADILQLLGSEDTQVDIEAPIDGLPPLEHTDSVDLSSTVAPPPVEMPAPEPRTHDSAGFGGVLANRGKQSKGGKLLKVALPIAIAFIVVAVVSAGLLIGSSKPPVKENKDLSFYPPEVEQEQLPLDQEFTEARETASEPIRIDLKDSARKQTAVDTQSKPQVRESVESAVIPVAEPKKPNGAEFQQAEEVEPKPEARPVETKKTPKEDTKPQDAKTEQPKAETSPRQYGEIRSWDEVQPLALDRGFRGNWSEAAQLWAPPLSTMSRDAYTLLIKRTNKTSDVSSVFERFANSARMRNEFYVIKRDSTFLVCWGFFPEKAAAQKALQTLPDRISQYRPAMRNIGDILTP